MPPPPGHETTSATARIRQAAVEDIPPLAGLMQQAVVLQQQFAGYYGAPGVIAGKFPVSVFEHPTPLLHV